MPLPLRFANVRFWPIADIWAGVRRPAMLMSAFDPKRTYELVRGLRMPNQHSKDEARAFNAALDSSLRSNGTVDRALFLRLRDAYTFQAASSVGWVEAKLRVMLGRVDQGLSLSLFSPVSNDQTVVETNSAFEQWAETNFPGTLK